MMPSKPVVLVVEDHEAARYVIMRVLSEAGYSVLEAGNGAEALQYAPGADVIVLDVHLPDMLGYEVCERLKADVETARIPVIFSSSTATDDFSVMRGKQVGAVEYLFSKPLDADTLVATIKKFIVKPK
jgi:two-component system NtrC family sensor kinase